MKSIDATGVPGEAAVNFSTQSVFRAPRFANVVSTVNTTSGGQLLILTSLLPENGQFVIFSSVPGGSGLSTGVPYLLSHAGTSAPNELFNLFLNGSPVTITAGSVTFSSLNPSLPTYLVGDFAFNHWMLDNAGFLWSDLITTTGGGSVPATNSWTWMQNPTVNAHGNGLALLRTANVANSLGVAWIFIFRDQAIA